MYNVHLVAKKIINLSDQAKKTVTPMQLIKLVYLSHGWMLGLYNRPLIKEDIEAWQYGPVIPELYRSIKHYRSHPVEKIDCEDQEIDESSESIINQVYEKYGDFSGVYLSMLTHEKGSPWEITWSSGKRVISNDLIAFFFQKLAQEK